MRLTRKNLDEKVKQIFDATGRELDVFRQNGIYNIRTPRGGELNGHNYETIREAFVFLTGYLDAVTIR